MKTRKQKCEGKQLYGYFKQQIAEIARKNTWKWQKKRHFKKETESLIKVAQNNAIKAKIENK